MSAFEPCLRLLFQSCGVHYYCKKITTYHFAPEYFRNQPFWLSGTAEILVYKTHHIKYLPSRRRLRAPGQFLESLHVFFSLLLLLKSSPPVDKLQAVRFHMLLRLKPESHFLLLLVTLYNSKWRPYTPHGFFR